MAAKKSNPEPTPTDQPTSVFAKWQEKLWPYRFELELAVRGLNGGVPSDPKVAEGWITRHTDATGDALRDAVVESMIERGLSLEEAKKEVADLKTLTGFKRDNDGLYYEGRQLKAAIKEAASVARANNDLPAKYGHTGKGVLSYIAEHVSVVEDRLPIMRDGDRVTEPDQIIQGFVHTFRGSAIKMTESVNTCTIVATIESDTDFKDEEWAAIWLAGERQGIGANRSQGAGRYVVVRWDRIS